MGDFRRLEREECFIPNDGTVTVTRMQHMTELQYMQHCNTKPCIRKLDADRYVVLEGDERGVIKEFNHTENRSEGFKSLKKTFKKLRYLINYNFVGGKNELFVTLTYAENMQDTKRLYCDFKAFIKRLRRFYDKKAIHFDYLSIIEPQQRGAWHCHVLFKFDCSEIYIDNAFMREKWGQGFVNVRRLADVDNIGAYVSAYLADLPISDGDVVSTGDQNKIGKGVAGVAMKDIDGVKKTVLKGGRLGLYPVGINLYRKSAGIQMPPRERMSYENAKKTVVGGRSPHYCTGVVVPVGVDKSNTIIYEQYNTRRS